MRVDRAGGAVMGRRSGWTAERDARLRKMWDAGVLCGEIGDALGVSGTTVWSRATELGLPLRRKPPPPRVIRACPYLHLVDGELKTCGVESDQQFCSTHRDKVKPLVGALRGRLLGGGLGAGLVDGRIRARIR